MILRPLSTLLPTLLLASSALAGSAYDGRIDALLAKMSLEEKVDQLGGMGLGKGEFGDETAGVFGTKGNPRVGIPDLIMGHGITGVRSGRDPMVRATYFCSPIGIGATWDTNLYAEVGVAMAREMRALNQDLNLGPTVNIIRHPLGGRTWESYSEDPFLSAQMIVPYVKAMQSHGVLCGPKHFAANNQEHQRFDINNVVDERTLREIYLPAFRAAVVDGGALNLMGSYNRLNGTFLCENRRMLTEIVREEWGFKGFILSDFGNGVHSTVPSARAGLNIEMHAVNFYGQKLVQAVRSGELEESVVDQLLREKLYAMMAVGMFDGRPPVPRSAVHSREHQDVALRVARATPVLLRNEGELLPLDRKQVRSLAVIGPNAARGPELPVGHAEYANFLQGGGSGRCYYHPESVVEPLRGLRELLGQEVRVEHARGAAQSLPWKKKDPTVDPGVLRQEAVRLVASADAAVLFVGLSGNDETEGWDRKSAVLPNGQDELIRAVAKVNPNTVVVVIAGTYVDMTSWIGGVKAVLFCPYAGERIGQALAEVLFGVTNPGGKLPISFPESLDQYPKGSIFTGAPFSKGGEANVYREGVFVGYRHFDRTGAKLLFPFGHGLSYTTFGYENLRVQAEPGRPVTATVLVRNTGKVAGDEVVQLYVKPPKSPVERPVRELKGFHRVALKPGEARTLTFTLGNDAFAYYGVAEKDWVVAPGRYVVEVGSSSRDLRQSAEVDR